MFELLARDDADEWVANAAAAAYAERKGENIAFEIARTKPPTKK